MMDDESCWVSDITYKWSPMEGPIKALPLTKTERDRYILMAKSYRREPAEIHMLIHTIEKLLAAEVFWREAVKNNEPAEYYGVYDRKRCYFCQHDLLELERSQQPSDWNAVNHEETCPWLLAQEGV